MTLASKVIAHIGWVYRFSPTNALLTTTRIPSRCSRSASPMPDCSGIRGEQKVPADRMTSHMSGDCLSFAVLGGVPHTGGDNAVRRRLVEEDLAHRDPGPNCQARAGFRTGQVRISREAPCLGDRVDGVRIRDDAMDVARKGVVVRRETEPTKGVSEDLRPCNTNYVSYIVPFRARGQTPRLSRDNNQQHASSLHLVSSSGMLTCRTPSFSVLDPVVIVYVFFKYLEKPSQSQPGLPRAAQPSSFSLAGGTKFMQFRAADPPSRWPCGKTNSQLPRAFCEVSVSGERGRRSNQERTASGVPAQRS